MGTTNTVTRRQYRRVITADDVALRDLLHTADPDAFTRLYQLHADTVTRYVAVRMRDKDRDAVEDLVQETFCIALAEPTLITADIVGSLLQLAARACTNHEWSRRRYVRAAYTVHDDARHRNTDTDADMSAPVTVAVLSRIRFAHSLARLTPDQRLAIQLRYIEEFPAEQTAVLMRRSTTALKSLERRAIRRLQATCVA